MTTITDPWEPIPTLQAIADAAERERIRHNTEQIRLMGLFDQWDRLSIEEKWHEWDKECDAEGDPQLGSPFYEVPGFTPVYCAGCVSYVFLDYRNSFGGVCPFDGAHSVGLTHLPVLKDAA